MCATNLLAQWTLWHESQLHDESGAEVSESELLLDDASLELSDANADGLVKSTDSATLTSSGCSTYIQSITHNFIKFLSSLAIS